MHEESFKLDTQAKSEETDSYDAADASEPVPPSDIVSYNELRSCADLFRLFETEKLEIQPDFQREVVWRSIDQTRFIDSLVKQLPIPSMCFSLDYKTQKWKVIDGLQRMSSIISFLGKQPWKMKNLDDIHPLLRDARNIELRDGSEEQKRLFTTVQDVSIPITVLRCDYTQDAHMQYLFTIFHRLNSGGVKLNNQEIRNCIFSGSFNDLLKEFDARNQDWGVIKKRIWGSSKRFRSIELLLRALAFSEGIESYEGNLAKFLNNYMHERIELPDDVAADLAEKLAAMSFAARSALGRDETYKISMTFIEATLVGILLNLEHVTQMNQNELEGRFTAMLSQQSFSEAAKYAIASENNVKTRMRTAINVFAG